MDANKIKDMILAECERNEVKLTEDELNEKVMEATELDLDKLERLSGGSICTSRDLASACWKDYYCIFFYQH